MAAAGATRQTLGQLVKQGWNEIPEIFASTGLALVGIGMCFYGINKYEKNDGDNKRYKSTYVIMRPDDPQVKKIRHD